MYKHPTRIPSAFMRTCIQINHLEELLHYIYIHSSLMGISLKYGVRTTRVTRFNLIFTPRNWPDLCGANIRLRYFGRAATVRRALAKAAGLVTSLWPVMCLPAHEKAQDAWAFMVSQNAARYLQCSIPIFHSYFKPVHQHADLGAERQQQGLPQTALRQLSRAPPSRLPVVICGAEPGKNVKSKIELQRQPPRPLEWKAVALPDDP